MREPLVIPTIPELAVNVAYLFEVVEEATVDGLFLRSLVIALSHAIGLELDNKGEARFVDSESNLSEDYDGGVMACYNLDAALNFNQV